MKEYHCHFEMVKIPKSYCWVILNIDPQESAQPFRFGARLSVSHPRNVWDDGANSHMFVLTCLDHFPHACKLSHHFNSEFDKWSRLCHYSQSTTHFCGSRHDSAIHRPAKAVRRAIALPPKECNTWVKALWLGTTAEKLWKHCFQIANFYKSLIHAKDLVRTFLNPRHAING